MWSWLDWGGNWPARHACHSQCCFAVEDLCSIDGWYKYCQNTLSEYCTLSFQELPTSKFSTPLPLPSTPISLSWLTGHQKSSVCLSPNTLPALLFPVPFSILFAKCNETECSYLNRIKLGQGYTDIDIDSFQGLENLSWSGQCPFKPKDSGMAIWVSGDAFTDKVVYWSTQINFQSSSY